ncbi:Phage minor capsid protein 2 [compost metagenome]
MKKYDIRSIFAQMEVDLIASMKRNLKRHENEEKKEGFEWEQWQRRKLQDLARYKTEAGRIIRNADPAIEATISQKVKGGFRRGASKVMNMLKRLLPSKFNVAAPDDSDEAFFRLNEKRVNSLVDASKGEMKAARFAMLRQADDVFRQTIFKSQMYLNSGAASLNQAIDMATKDFLDKGFDCIQFANGRRMNVASYAEMALRTSSQRAVFTGEGAKRKELGIHTVIVSTHNNCSSLCLPWQGKVFIDDVYSGGKASDGPYPLLSTAMKAGLFHHNCRHNMATFIPGKSRLPEPVDDSEALENYEAEQKQRYMERQVRKYKRREAGSVDPNNQTAAAAKVKEWQGKLREHVKVNEHLRRDPSREKILGGVSQAEHNELLKLAANNAKIKETRAHIRSDAQTKTLHMGHQGKHIKGHNNYIDGKSYLTIPAEEAQELVKRYAGTGTLNMTKKGEWKNQELIDSDTIVGKAIDQFTGEEFETKSFKIHYGKKGVHIVPTKRGEGE